MTKRSFHFTFFLLMWLSIPVTAPAQTANLPDANLRAVIEAALGKTSGATITVSDMAGLTSLEARNANISDLTGLEHATNLRSLNLGAQLVVGRLTNSNLILDISPLTGLTNLTSLNLGSNNISDISPLTGLTNLTRLYLSDNSISDISAVVKLTNLTWLFLESNNISDVSPLTGLTNLTWLYLSDNSISDISAVAGLTSLTKLLLGSNNISDISAVAGLTNLTWLFLGFNNISDISALVTNTSLGSEDTVNVKGNPLSSVSIDTHIPALQSRGVMVMFDDIVAGVMVDLPDSNLRAVIEKALGKAAGGIITTSDMAALPRLEARNANISDLTGLEYAINLTLLDFWNNSISDISALAGLTNLETLLLEHNSISDISVLAELTNLEILLLKHNSISDISVLAGLTNLTELYLGSNNISDISLLTGLTNLTHLYLSDNSISDISAVTELTNLIALNLWENSISDISVVAGLTKLQLLILSRNSLSDISAVAGLTNLETLHLDRNSISDISAVAGLTKLTWLALDRNSISDISALVANTGLGSGDRINVKVNPLNPVSIDTHIPVLQGRGVTVEFDDIVAGVVVDIPDSNLHAAIAAALSKAAGDTITTSDMATLNHLRAREPKISDLTGLEYAINLTLLEFRNNSISDISAVAGLTNLRALHLSGNPVSDISAVAGLTNLASLTLQANSISDISAVAGLTDLSYLNLNWNSISDISAVAGLTKLIALYLSGNSISDISAVAGLTNLYSLSLRNNSISDISAVAGLTKLTQLFLSGNSISDLSALVANAGLGSGNTVNVKGNPLSAVSINTHILALQSRGVTVSFDDRAHPALLKISGDNQKGAAFTPLSHPFIVEAQDRNGSALAGISVTFAVIEGGGTLSIATTRTDANGRAQSTLMLGPNPGTNTVQVSADGIEVPVTFHAIADTESPPIMADVNGDGVVNIFDLVSVAGVLGTEGQNLMADVNGDSVVNILDLVLVAGMFGDAAAAPSAQRQTPETLTAVEVQQWLTDARLLKIRDPIMKRGFVVLEQLLIALTPSETELLPNYPNPFNPETWIPYRLAEDTFVTLTIYDQTGQVVRTLDVGHRIAAVYEGRSKAIYWDGRNEVGEGVASGVYFYHLSAGAYSATRKMLILK